MTGVQTCALPIWIRRTGYNRLVTFGEHYRETKAGNDIKMAAGYPERIKEAYEKGLITEAEIRLSARRILNMILKID